MSIGKTLAEARESAGLTVDEVAHATRIRRTLVLGIENDDWSGCGGDFYARGHIRSIASKVGADPASLMAEFDSGHRRDAPPTRAAEVFESERLARPERRGPNWSAAMMVALVLVLGYGVMQAFSAADDQPGRSDVIGPTATTTPKPPTATNTAAPSDPGESAVAQAPGKVTVAVHATDRSWVQVTTANGQELFQGLVPAGQGRSWTDKARLKLVIGNAGGVRLTVNGTDVGAAGRTGQVARLEFTPADPAAG